ncbi:MAG: hypothetical protein F4X98_00660 [Gammaproteobacteria bacterium]|nr:hypothetical protein [Gammaproteobacteria bacterium]
MVALIACDTPVTLIGLRGDGSVRIGAPSAVVHHGNRAAVLQPRNCRLLGAKPPNIFRLRELCRRPGADEHLDRRVLVIDPRAFLPKLRVVHETLLQFSWLRHHVTCLTRCLAVARARRGVLRANPSRAAGSSGVPAPMPRKLMQPQFRRQFARKSRMFRRRPFRH